MNGCDWSNKSRSSSPSVDLELPSGMVIRARRPGPLQLAAWGRLPESLVPVAAGQSLGDAVHGMTDDALAATGKFLGELVEWCCLRPRVSLDASGPDEILPRDIPEQDWLAICAWALRLEEVDAMRPFRVERGVDAPGGDGEGVRGASVNDARSGRSCRGAGDRHGGGGEVELLAGV